MPFTGRNPLYYVFHESSYADGHPTNWAAEAVEPEDFRADPTLLTGEHVRPDWADTVPPCQPWREVVQAMAQGTQPKLYCPHANAPSGVGGAAALSLLRL